jgi:Fic family protein
MSVPLQLTLRQKALLIIIEQQEDGVLRDRLNELVAPGFPMSKATLLRDLSTLIKQDLVRTVGKGPATHYAARAAGQLLCYYDMPAYFGIDPDSRPLTTQSNEEFFQELRTYPLLSEEEKAELTRLNTQFQKRLATREPDILRREQERFTTELAWKSSRIEGNTYSLLETEELLKAAQEAPGHAAQEAQMILNHKAALDWVMAERDKFRALSLEGVLGIHRLLVSGLGIGEGIRKQPVGITGTTYLPPDNATDLQRQLTEALRIANEADNPLASAIIASALIAYLQPFSDGNKRTARLVGNAVLLAHDYAALSYRSVDEIAYKESVLLADEQHSLYWYKRLFLEQFRFACEKYFN